MPGIRQGAPFPGVSSSGDPMRRSILTRLERLEAILAPKQVRTLCYGWLATLPADYSGERHIVIVKQEPTGSPHFEWYEWEERPGPAPSVPPVVSWRPRAGHDLVEPKIAAARGRLPTERC
jgi:hypothetical protein